VTRLSTRDGLLIHSLTVDPQWDGSVMLHALTAAPDDAGSLTSLCIEPALLDQAIEALIAVRDGRPVLGRAA
jgi:hypothetical protein